MTCAFCEIAAGTGPAVVVAEWLETIAILPRERDGKRGCTEGHILVIPRVHVPDAAADSLVTATTMARAAELAARLRSGNKLRAFNIIINAGEEAGQTVDHLHVHLVPRRAGDGLAMPWPHPAAA